MRYLAFLGLFLAATCSLNGAVFNIGNGDIAALKSAITTSNSNNEDDTINLAANGTYTLTAVDNGSTGEENGLPVVQSDAAHALTINGNGATLTRSIAQNTPEFRLMEVSGGNVTISRTTLSNGVSSGFGGAVELVSGALALASCTVTQNSANGGFGGGGAVAAGNGMVTVNNCTFTTNTGAALVNTSASVSIFGSFFTGNNNAVGGAILNIGTTTVFNSTFTANTASGGGAIAQGGGHLTLVNCTITQNNGGTQQQSGVDGGISISNGAPITLLNTIVAANNAAKRPDIGGSDDNPVAVNSLGHNLIGIADTSSGWVGSDLTGTSANPFIAGLGPAGTNGGPTQTVPLLPGSPAIDAGDDSVLSSPDNLTTDQRGYPRKIGSHVDIGAFEFDPPQSGMTFTVTTTDDHDDRTCGEVDCSLRDAINAAGLAGSGAVVQFAPAATGEIGLTGGELSFGFGSGMTINGPGARSLTIQGDGQHRVANIISGTIVISGLTISHGGQSGGSAAETNQGGAIFNEANLTLNDCTLIGNTVAGASNSANGGNGGSAQGGAIYNKNHLTLNRCTFSTNSVTGAPGAAFSPPPGTTGGPGGDGGLGEGGAIFNASNTQLTVTECTFNGNTATGGAGGATGGTSSTKAPGGDGKGGAIFDGGASTIISCTISGNTGTGGKGFGSNISPGPRGSATGGVSVGSSPGQHAVANSIIAGNTASGANPAPDADGVFTSDGFNLIGVGDQSSGFTATGDQVGTSAHAVSPGLDSLKDNGGPTDTMALLSGSAALDAGNSFGLATDQRGAPRPFDDPSIANVANASDIGAFEFGATVPTPTPTPTPTATATATATPSATVTPTATPTPASQLQNLSTRKQVGTADNVLIGGFIVVGIDDKQVLLRGLGPSLPVQGVLADPVLELHRADTTLLAANDNWRDAVNASDIAAILPPPDDHESAILTTLTAKPLSEGGAGYTGVLSGSGGTTGIGLLEIYDLNTAANSSLANISTRGLVGTGDDLLIGGFIPGPADRLPMKVLVRALGPSLSAQGVSGALQDPLLELHDANGTLIVNDNWRDASNADEIQATLPPPDDHESAIITILAPANSGYTAVVRGVNNSTGVALVEVYALH